MKLEFVKKFNDAVEMLKEEGFRFTLQRYRKRLYNKLHYIIFERDLTKELPSFNADPNLKIEIITKREDLRIIDNLYWDLSVLYEIFDEGCIPFFAYYDHKLAGYAWVIKKVDKKRKKDIQYLLPPLRKEELGLCRLFVLPEYRIKAVTSVLVIYVLRFASKEGFKRIISIIQENNKVALNKTKRLGFLPIGKMTHTRFIKWNHVKVSYNRQ